MENRTMRGDLVEELELEGDQSLPNLTKDISFPHHSLIGPQHQTLVPCRIVEKNVHVSLDNRDNGEQVLSEWSPCQQAAVD